MKLLDDTTPEARRVLIDGFRRMSVARRCEIMEDSYRTARILHEMGYRQRHPNATCESVRADWAALTLGSLVSSCPERGGTAVDPQSLSNLPIIREVMSKFQHLGIPCALGGSWASSLYGVPRLTHDADLTSAPFPGRAAEFVAQFGLEYYVSQTAVESAVAERSTFNIIQTLTNFKIDVFIQKSRPFDVSVLQRRTPVSQPGLAGEPLVLIAPEDIILHKLEWFRLGGEISDKQWGDILGVLRVQADRLDAAYLDQWAAELGVADLLAQAREQV
ncbi:MAG: hypothetical protein ACJ8F7_14960 [Gemmataceae bacterium]